MNIKKIRLLADKTQKETAKAINTTQATYSNYETGKTAPDIETLIKLADYFHTTIDNLCGHSVPYLMDKSTLTQKQRNLAELLPHLSNMVCDKAEAYINGLLEGERRQREIYNKFNYEEE